jgi:hypothetical protein
MCGRSVLVHGSRRLGAAAPVLAAELQCRDGVFATFARERGQAVHHLDRVMSHGLNCSLLTKASLRTKVTKAGIRVHPVSLPSELVGGGPAPHFVQAA